MIPKMLLRKRLGFLVLIVALAGVTLPFPRVFASTGPTLTVGCENPVGAICVDSQSSSGLPGSSFTAAIFLVNVTGFIGYDISMNWNQSVLQVTSVLDGNWSTGLSAFTLTNMTSQSTGTVQYSQVLLGNPTNIANSTLFIVVFKFLGYGSTPIALSSVNLTGLVNGVVSILPPPTIINGRAFTPPPSSAALIHYKAKAAFKTLAGGSTQTLVADILTPVHPPHSSMFNTSLLRPREELAFKRPAHCSWPSAALRPSPFPIRCRLFLFAISCRHACLSAAMGSSSHSAVPQRRSITTRSRVVRIYFNARPFVNQI